MEILAPTELAARAHAAVLRHAAAGELPPFVLSLHAPAASLSGHKPPETFLKIMRLLSAARAPQAAPEAAAQLARTIAAACFGSRHLWQDLRLAGRDEVSRLLAACFPALYAANIHNLKWKRFLFAEASAQFGGEPFPPGCPRCGNYRSCFPPFQTDQHVNIRFIEHTLPGDIRPGQQ